jgi:serine/threonine-protein kinase
MPTTSPFAFLQPTARTILMPAPLGGGLPPGTRVGAWQLASSGHRLGNRTRHAAVHRETARQAVIELYDAPSLLGSYTDCMRDVIAEVTRLDHPGAPAFHDCGTLADGRPYLVREAIDGYTLAELRAEGALPARAVINVVRGICEVVQAAHAAGVKHGVLDLEQVLVRDGDDRIILLDWRFANAVAEEAFRRARVTAMPSWRVHEAHSVAEDVFDLGVMMLQLLGDEVPPSLESLAIVMCAEDPGARPTLEIVLARLAAADDALDTVTVSATEVPLPPELRIPSFLTSRAWRLSSLALACLAPIALVAWHDDDHSVSAANVAPPAMNEPAPPPSEPTPPASPTPTPTPIPTPTPTLRPAATSPTAAMPATQAKPASVKVAAVRPTTVAAATAKPASDPVPRPVSRDGTLLRQYQRVGHDLIELERKVGPMDVAELRTAFREIHIDEAMATAASRQEATLALTDLARRIERVRPIEISDSCKSNPLAGDCH